MKLPGPDHPITIEPNPQRVRVVAGGLAVAETRRALILREASLPPVQYIPRDDAAMDRLRRTGHHTTCPYKGEASYFTILGSDGREIENAVWSYEAPFPAVEAIRGHLAFYPRKVDSIDGG
jgi:uncharacterized protein (DUF427 family)